MKSNSRSKIYLVYGNHGEAPHQIEDYLEYLLDISKSLGFDMIFTREPVPGETNILMEYFDAPFVQRVEKCARQKGTKFIAIATEFVTGKTFNRFQDGKAVEVSHKRRSNLPLWLDDFLSHTIPVVVNPHVRDLLVALFPKTYLRAKELYLSRFDVPIQSTYDNEAYWIKRFRNFERASRFCEAIWCVTPHQLEGYKNYFYSQSIELLPIASWTPEPINAYQGRLPKDIDFLFTGSATPHRKELLDQLTAKGYRVVVGTPAWPKQLRENFTARSKVTLHIKQNAQWKYPSVMRYHYLLTSGSIVVAEESFEHCMQEKFLTLTPADQFVTKCEALIAAGSFERDGLEACHKYFAGSESARGEVRALFAKYILTGETSNVVEPSLSLG